MAIDPIGSNYDPISYSLVSGQESCDIEITIICHPFHSHLLYHPFPILLRIKHLSAKLDFFSHPKTTLIV